MWTVIDSPIGELRLVERAGAITAIEFSPFGDGRRAGRGAIAATTRPVLVEAARQLAAYFAGDRATSTSRSPRRARRSSSGSGRSCGRSATARPRRTARSRAGSA